MEGDYLFYPTAHINGKANYGKYTVLFFENNWRKMERPLWIFDLIVPFLGKIWLEVGQDGKS